MRTKRKGLFYFAVTEGLPLDMSLLHLRRIQNLDAGTEFVLICEFMVDALRAGWTPRKVLSDVREAAAIVGGSGWTELLKACERG